MPGERLKRARQVACRKRCRASDLSWDVVEAGGSMRKQQEGAEWMGTGNKGARREPVHRQGGLGATHYAAMTGTRDMHEDALAAAEGDGRRLAEWLRNCGCATASADPRPDRLWEGIWEQGEPASSPRLQREQGTCHAFLPHCGVVPWGRRGRRGRRMRRPYQPVLNGEVRLAVVVNGLLLFVLPVRDMPDRSPPCEGSRARTGSPCRCHLSRLDKP